MLFGKPSPLVLLDANAIRDHFRPTFRSVDVLARLRARAVEAVDANALRIVLTQPLLWELTSIVERESLAAYEEAVRWFIGVGRAWILRSEAEREPLELRRRRRLMVSEVYAEAPAEPNIAQSLDPTWIARYRAQLLHAKRHEREREAEARRATVDAATKREPDWRAMLDRELSADEWNRNVAGMVRIEMRRAARRHRLRISGPGWPLPESVPTFWFGESFLAAKARHVFVDTRRELTSNKSIKAMPDLIDGTHFRDAAYVDVLVTSDENFATVARNAHVPLQVVSFDDYATALLA